VRRALGASGADVLRLVLGRALLVTVVGVVIGVAGAMMASRLLESLLYDVSARDAATFTTVAAATVLVSLAACLVPVWRALRVHPVTALQG
jgi:putative ABC transport system permease protein